MLVLLAVVCSIRVLQILPEIRNWYNIHICQGCRQSLRTSSGLIPDPPYNLVVARAEKCTLIWAIGDTYILFKCPPPCCSIISQSWAHMFHKYVENSFRYFLPARMRNQELLSVLSTWTHSVVFKMWYSGSTFKHTWHCTWLDINSLEWFVYSIFYCRVLQFNTDVHCLDNNAYNQCKLKCFMGIVHLCLRNASQYTQSSP